MIHHFASSVHMFANNGCQTNWAIVSGQGRITLFAYRCYPGKLLVLWNLFYSKGLIGKSSKGSNYLNFSFHCSWVLLVRNFFFFHSIHLMLTIYFDRVCSMLQSDTFQERCDYIWKTRCFFSGEYGWKKKRTVKIFAIASLNWTKSQFSVSNGLSDRVISLLLLT